MLFRTIKPEKELKLSVGVTIKNVGTFNARLGLTLPPDVMVLRNNNHRKRNHRKNDSGK